MKIPRALQLGDYLRPGKVTLIYGARQVGKTSLVQEYLEKTHYKYQFLRGEYTNVQFALGSLDEATLNSLVEGLDLLVIDEAQAVPKIGLALKLLIDAHPSLRIVVTGSAAFELAGQIGEPLVGRQITLQLLPLWEHEIRTHQRVDPFYHLEQSLLYGRYPEVWTAGTNQSKKEILSELVNGYLLKDIFMLEDLKRPDLLRRLLGLLAYQIGSEVSIQELAQQLGLSRGTVERYIDLLEYSFIIFRLRPYADNPRKTLGKKQKIYFYDLGVRNSLIGDFNRLEERSDTGHLWENFCIIERIKKNIYEKHQVQKYFWRAVSGGEVDYLEMENGRFSAFEFKWNPKKEARPPLAFRRAHTDVQWETVSPKNYHAFVVEFAKSEILGYNEIDLTSRQ